MRGAREARFADLNGVDLAEAATMLKRLDVLQATARRGGRLEVDVECVSDIQDQPCPDDKRRLVASLPTGGAYHFRRGYDAPRPLELAMTETLPGNAYWEASFIQGPRPTLRLTRQYPAPF